MLNGKFKILDLFSGAGGLTRGFVDTDKFIPVMAFEMNKDARQSYIKNFHPTAASKATTEDGDVFVYPDATDVPDKLPFELPEFDILIGGPPCQDFTQLTAVRKEQSRKRNNLLWDSYIKVVLTRRPKVFVIENVPNLLTDPEHQEQRDKLLDDVTKAGYRIVWGILNAANFGVPQSRYRAIIIGTRLTKEPYLPFPDLTTKVTWDAIRDLSTKVPDHRIPRGTTSLSGDELHVGRTAEVLSRLRYRYVLPDGNRMHIPSPVTIRSWVKKHSGTSDGYGRLYALRPSTTIRCEGFKPEKGRYLHPFEHRPLTLAEMARLQTFPRNHVFHGSYTSIGRQIGNAVPPKLAERIAWVVFDLLTAGQAEVVTRPVGPVETKEVVDSSRRATISQAVLAYLSSNVQKPVPWWQIEAVVKCKTGAHVTDWATPVRDLVEQGYEISVGKAAGLRPGEYRLDSLDPKPLPKRPPVQRLFALELERRTTCERCQVQQATHARFVRKDSEILIAPGNVEVLCGSCWERYPEPAGVSISERDAYEFISRYRFYPPVVAELRHVLGVSREQQPEGSDRLLSEKVTLPEVPLDGAQCDLCGTSSGPLIPDYVRPFEHKGLPVQENVWVLCDPCRHELAKAEFKVPVEGEEGRGAKGRMAHLADRFGEEGFLTLKEAFIRNWLLQYTKDRVIKMRAQKAFLTGNWQ